MILSKEMEYMSPEVELILIPQGATIMSESGFDDATIIDDDWNNLGEY